MKFQQHKWAHDPRSKKFSHHRFFGTLDPKNLPATLGRSLGPILNQQNTLRCTGYGNAANGWYIHGRNFSPDWAAAKIGQKQGRSVDGYGGDPNACMKSMRDDGFLPRELAPYSLEINGVEGSGWNVWPKDLDAKAVDNVEGYVRVDGPFDTFDDIRSALYQAYDPKTGRGAAVDAFSGWYEEWNRPIVGRGQNLLGFHRFIFVDWKTINGVTYLIAHNSWGTDVGDRGFQLFTREEVNREFSLSGRTLKIVKTLTKEQVDLAKQETIFGRIQLAIIEIWYELSELYG